MRLGLTLGRAEGVLGAVLPWLRPGGLYELEVRTDSRDEPRAARPPASRGVCEPLGRTGGEFGGEGESGGSPDGGGGKGAGGDGDGSSGIGGGAGGGGGVLGAGGIIRGQKGQ